MATPQFGAGFLADTSELQNRLQSVVTLARRTEAAWWLIREAVPEFRRGPQAALAVT